MKIIFFRKCVYLNLSSNVTVLYLIEITIRNVPLIIHIIKRLCAKDRICHFLVRRDVKYF